MQDQQSSTGPVGGSPVAVVDEIRAVEHKRLRALVDGDIEVTRSLHADDFQLITPSGVAHTKESYLAAVSSGDIDYSGFHQS